MAKISAKPSRRIVVEGETFHLTIDGPSYQLTWLPGPNPGYGSGERSPAPAAFRNARRC
jgi:hypothetical protein